MDQYKYDERQLWIRGEVFKHCLFLMGFLILLNTFLIDNNITLVEGIWANILIISITTSLGSIEMILKNGINFDDKRTGIAFLIIGLCGLIIIILNLSHLVSGDKIITNDQLTKNGAFLLMAILYAVIPVVYFMKYKENKNED